LVVLTFLVEFLQEVTFLILPSLCLGDPFLVQSALLVGVHDSLEGIELNFHLSALNSVLDDFILLKLGEAVSASGGDSLKDI